MKSLQEQIVYTGDVDFITISQFNYDALNEIVFRKSSLSAKEVKEMRLSFMVALFTIKRKTI